MGRLQGEVDQAGAKLKEREAEERRLCLNVEQLETDLRSSKAFTESLQAELQEKEQREVEMLGEKEQAVAEVTRVTGSTGTGSAQLCPRLTSLSTLSGCGGGQERGREPGPSSRGGAGAETGGAEGPGGKTEEV